MIVLGIDVCSKGVRVFQTFEEVIEWVNLRNRITILTIINHFGVAMQSIQAISVYRP